MGTITLEEIVKARISGYVLDTKGAPIESARLKIKDIKTRYKNSASSDADGFFEFENLEADTYVIFANKKGYKKAKQTVKLEDEEQKEIEKDELENRESICSLSWLNVCDDMIVMYHELWHFIISIPLSPFL